MLTCMAVQMCGCLRGGWGLGVGVEGDVWKATPVQEPGDIHCLP